MIVFAVVSGIQTDLYGAENASICKGVVLTVNGLLSCNHRAIRAEIITIRVDFCPSGLHFSGTQEIVLLAVYSLPSGAGDTVCTKIIGAVFQRLPSGLELSLFGEVVQVPVNGFPVI